MSAEEQSRIAELFGHGTDAAADWDQIVSEQNCPFTSKRCFKVRKSDPTTSVGTCVVRAGREFTPLIICPDRLLPGGQVFDDALHLLTHHAAGDEYHLVPEVKIPGGSVDYFVVSVKDGQPVDFVGIELQALDTSGTVWPHRQRFLSDVGVVVDHDAEDDRGFGMNWKMTAKTILVQLHHKTRTFEEIDRKLVLVLQQEPMDYMSSEFSFGHLADGTLEDSLHFHPYRLVPDGTGLMLEPGARKSTDAAGIAQALSLGDETRLEAEEIFTRLRAKLESSTRWQPGARISPPPILDASDD